MSSTTDNDNAVDSKKNGNDSAPNYIGFAKDFGKSLLHITKIIALGSIGLYICKVAQANLLPDNLEQIPFGPNSRNINPIPIAMNVIKEYPFHGLKVWADEFDVKVTSQKAIFNGNEFLDTYKQGFVSSLNKKATVGHSNITLYYSKVFNDCVAWNNWLINYIFIFFNAYLPEWTIITLIGYFFLIVFIPALTVANFGISILAHVMNLPQMFRRKTDETSGLISWFVGHKSGSKSKWQPEGNIDYFSLNMTSHWIFFFIWSYPVSMIATIVMPIAMTFYTLLSPLFATYILKNEPPRKDPYGFLAFVKSVFTGHKVLIKILVTLALIDAMIKNFQGKYYMPALAATIVGVLFSALKLNFYQSQIDPNIATQTTGETSYRQAKISSATPETPATPATPVTGGRKR